MEQALARIKAARESGQVVGADIYPYINNGLGLAALIHPRHSAEGAAGLRKRLDDPAARAEIRREMETQGNWENWFRHVGSDWDKVVLALWALLPTPSTTASRSATFRPPSARTRGMSSSRRSSVVPPRCPKA